MFPILQHRFGVEHVAGTHIDRKVEIFSLQGGNYEIPQAIIFPVVQAFAEIQPIKSAHLRLQHRNDEGDEERREDAARSHHVFSVIDRMRLLPAQEAHVCAGGEGARRASRRLL